jgi:hypothetical protein
MIRLDSYGGLTLADLAKGDDGADIPEDASKGDA